MDNISLDSENPFLYLAGAAGVSLLINLYCCLHKCRNSNEKTANNSKKTELYELNNSDSNSVNNIDNVELTEQFTNIVLPTLPETPTNVTTNTQETQTKIVNSESLDIDVDIEMGKPTIETAEMTTQTEDCELYEMMGERFSQELDYYRTMNMKKK